MSTSALFRCPNLNQASFRTWGLCAVFTLTNLYTPAAAAWGERGHDLVTRVAVRIVGERLAGSANGEKLAATLLDKEHQLAHLSNIPDTSWRGGDDKTRSENAPTHFVDAEYLVGTTSQISSDQLPATIDEALKLIGSRCSNSNQPVKDDCAPGHDKGLDVFASVGTAPWRIAELSASLQAAWTELKKLQDAKADAKLQTTHFDEALKYAGILSHFVGDLAQPLHTTKNYDGWETAQGGIHSFYESEVVNTLPLAFDQMVLDYALKEKPYNKVTKSAKKTSQTAPLNLASPQLAWTLLVDSHSELNQLLEADRQLVIARSQKTKEGVKIPAKRPLPAKAAQNFQKSLTKRMATGADFLAAIWIQAWQNAGQPDLSVIRSFHYHHNPDFIPVGYLQK